MQGRCAADQDLAGDHLGVVGVGFLVLTEDLVLFQSARLVRDACLSAFILIYELTDEVDAAGELDARSPLEVLERTTFDEAAHVQHHGVGVVAVLNDGGKWELVAEVGWKTLLKAETAFDSHQCTFACTSGPRR